MSRRRTIPPLKEFITEDDAAIHLERLSKKPRRQGQEKVPQTDRSFTPEERELARALISPPRPK